MGRGKVELKRIDDKSSRHVSFSKRRNGLMKKSHELSVLCDVDVALFVFSASGRLYEFSNGESMTKILSRYQNFKNAEELVRTAIHEQLTSEYTGMCTVDELTEMIRRHLDEQNIKKLDVRGLNHLEQQLHDFRQQVRVSKTQVMMGAVKALKEKEMELKKENEFILGEIMAARTNEINKDDGDARSPQLPVMNLCFI